MKKTAAIILFCLVVFTGTSSAKEVTLFASGPYERTSEKPDVFSTAPFTAYPGQGRLIVENGSDAGENRTSSAEIILNDETIFGPSDFNQNVHLLEAPINLVENNSITVKLAGKPDSYITVAVIEDVDPPTVTLTSDPGFILIGESSTLTWESANAEACSITPDIAPVDVNGSVSVTPTETTTYTITATGLGGTASSTATVTVVYPPTVEISATPQNIESGESSKLIWTSTHAKSATIDQGIGSVAVVGSTSVAPTETTTYEITVTGPGGTATANTTLTVEQQSGPEPQPEGSFGKQYNDLIPSDATVEYYDEKRFSLITGLVRDQADAPIEGVSITMLDHPEYGTVTTDVQGRFSIPVEGGATLTVVYQTQGRITAHRKVYVPWNDTAIAETIQMIAEDQVSTTLTFNGNPDTVVTHQSTVVTDDFGSRSASMVFTGDNQAFLVDEYGNDVQELSTITTRATEYTTPESMPAELPANSAYTYCVELSVDGARRVRFAKPVIGWVDNFLGFDVGMAVPVGYYDRDKGVWMPSDNGVVVKLLDTNGDGEVDALDANGDDLPDDLDADNSFIDEVKGLDDPSRYAPGSTFWRFKITHFTPWDCNWPYGPPEDATPPNAEGTAVIEQAKPEEPVNPPDNVKCLNSYVENRSRVFHEDIPIPGTDLTLHYASDRVKGYQSLISVPVSGDTVPESLKRIVVRVEIAGRSFEQILDPLPNQMTEFLWDGYDQLGGSLLTPINAHVSIGFVYDAVYLSPGNFAQAFAQAGDQVTGIEARREIISWRHKKLLINSSGLQSKNNIAEGWTLSNVHSVNLPFLYKGDGTIERNRDIAIVEPFAGNGVFGYSGDGGPAIDAQIGTPTNVAVDAAGNIYFTGSPNYSVRKVDPSGIVTTVAGNGQRGFSVDGRPAIAGSLGQIYAIAVDDTGNLYIGDQYNYRIWKVDTDGIIRTFAGKGYRGELGDGGPATDATINTPRGIALDSAGNFYYSDAFWHRVRKIDTNGIITTIAGNGVAGYSGDGGLAVAANLNLPHQIAVDPDGNLYIVDQRNYCIRRVDAASGIITTVAGNGVSGYTGDGTLATTASLGLPTGIAVDSAGNFFIADPVIARVHKVDVNGIITTAAGNGTFDVYEPSSDGLPATETSLYPYAIAVDDVGSLYIADRFAYRIRKIATHQSPISQLAFGEIPYTEENGLSHIFSSSGMYKMAIDSDSGVILRSFSYDQDNNLQAITDQFENTISIERDTSSGVPNAIISPDGIRTKLSIDSNNHLIRVVYPDDSSYSFEYTTDGLMIAEIDPVGNGYGHDFDSTGRLTDVLDEEGGHWNYQRAVEANGDITTQITSAMGNVTYYSDHTASTGEYSSIVTDSTGAGTSFLRSADGLTVNESLSCGMDLEFKYDVDSEYKFKYIKESSETAPSGLERVTLRAKTYEDTDADDTPNLVTETVTANGKTTTLEHNILQARKTVTSPEGRSVTTLYDPNSLLTQSVSIPGLHDTTYAYDGRGRLISMHTNTRQTTFTYNSEGWLDSITDPENLTTYYDYDVAGRITTITRPDNSFLDLIYDSNGNMTVLTNPAGIDHKFGFNKVNKNSVYTTPFSGSYRYVYDRDRRLIQTNFPSGQQTNYIYTNTQLTQIQTPEGNIDYTYLCGTKVDSISNGSETITYDYDGKLVTFETLGGTLNQIINYSYDNDFKLNSLTYAGDTSSYAYDNDGLMTGAGNFLIARNAQNGLPESLSGGALNLSRVFNGYGEVEEQTSTVAGQNSASWSLVRDRNGRITHKTETINGVTADYVYSYDSMGRLLTVNKDGDLVEAYQYDVAGARIYETNTLRGISGRELNYYEEDHLLSAGSTTYEYDLDGFLTTKTEGTNVTRFDYSSRGELLSVTLPDGTLIEYLHDPLGRRVAKKVDGTIVKKYLWQGRIRLLAVYDGTDNLLMRFEYADSHMPIAMTSSKQTYYLSYDQVGSLRLIADSSGNAIKLIEYDSFGNIVTDTNPAFDVPFGFAGGLHDRDTELVRFGYRDYSPDVGRWTAKDPIFFAGGDTDLYGYVQNNPINWTDPQGLFRFSTGMNAEGQVEEGIFRRIGRWLVHGPLGKCTLFPEKCKTETKCGPSGGGIRG